MKIVTCHIFKNLFLLLLIGIIECHSCGIKNKRIKVCVIGAGPSGLSAIRQLSKNLDKFHITVFERSFDIGGQWIYSDKTGFDEYGYPIHSSMYKSLRTNGPKEIMHYPDYPSVIKGNRSSISHDTYLKYLKNYTDHFKLRRFIQFNTIVENVSLYKPKNISSDKWLVKVKELKTSKTKEIIFDAVIVCNGHFFDPYIPKIPGLKKFHGQILHSHSYRKPEIFKGKKVIILGASFSGTDIALDLIHFASKIYLSHNHEQLPEYSGITQVKGVDRFEQGKFILKDNTTVKADVILFCTGYNYKFPFLDKSANITVDNNYIKFLYKHLINVNHPTMSFIGIPGGPVEPATYFVQAEYVVSILDGQNKLPPKSVMLEDAKLKTKRKKDAHLFSNPPAYNKELEQLGGLMPIPKFYTTGLDTWLALMKPNPWYYKDYNLIISPDKKTARIVKAVN